jgi:hypothetical protein
MGNEIPQIRIIDNFYSSLDWLMPYLEKNVGRKNENVNYAGLVFPAPQPMTDLAIEKVKHLGLPLDVDFVKSQGELRLTVQEDNEKYRYLIHADDSFNILIYLSGDKAGNTGTVFYRHRDLGLTRVPDNSKQAAKMSLLFEHDSRSLERWEVVKEVEFKPNRAIMFDGRFFHSVPSVFYGDGVRGGRVTQNFFFPYKAKYEV